MATTQSLPVVTTTVWGNVDGDAVADLVIQLSGSIALISSDLIL